MAYPVQPTTPERRVDAVQREALYGTGLSDEQAAVNENTPLPAMPDAFPQQDTGSAMADASDADAGINADTQIIVNPGASTPVYAPAPLPVYAQPQPLPTPARIVQEKTIDTDYTPVDSNTETKTVTHQGVNWGSVAKGAAIVTAVAVAGVVAFSAFTALGGAALAVPGVSTIIGTGTTVASSIATAFSSVAGYVAGFAPTILPTIGDSAAVLVGGITGTSAAAVGTVNTVAASTAIGALGAGGIVAGAATVAVPAIASLDLVNTHTHTVTQTLMPHDHVNTMTTTTTQAADNAMDPTGVDTGPTNHASTHESHLLPNMFTAKPEVGVSAHELEHHSAHAFEMGHHSMHEHAHSEAHSDMAADTPETLPAGARTKRWTQRIGAALSPDMQSGSYVDKVTANRTASAPIAPRGTDFTSALDSERLKLEASLGASASV